MGKDKITLRWSKVYEYLLGIIVTSVLIFALVPTMYSNIKSAERGVYRANAKYAYTSAIAQKTAIIAGIEPSGKESYESSFNNGKMNQVLCSKLHHDFYDVASIKGDNCSIIYSAKKDKEGNITELEIISAVYNGETYPSN